MTKRYAIIDMGTNTFNLAVFEYANGSVSYLEEDRIAVKLGEGGILSKTIMPEAIQRGINALKTHKETASKWGVNHIEVFATSAVRDAENKLHFLAQIKEQVGLSVQVITGEKEAEYIYLGVRESIQLGETPKLILDIGGGSNEVILANRHKIFWKHSFNLGVARLLASYPHSNPITDSEFSEIVQQIEKQIQPLTEALQTFPTDTLIGASGSFDTLKEAYFSIYPEKAREHGNSFRFNQEEMPKLFKMLCFSTAQERAEMPFIPPYRREMIVMGLLFFKAVLNQGNFTTLYQSNYALKEGVMFNLIKNLQHE
ncbi:MAG: Ppx/GppA phosphatase family protein [Luteibaculaceae bacterium]